MNQLILLAVAEKLAARRAYKQFASGDLAARKARLGNRSRQQLRADLDALMNERRPNARQRRRTARRF